MAMKQTNDMTDAAVREKALDVAASFVVQAPAGSGKTELLMQRFLALLSVVEKPEQILALTFTRKAAGEMHTRIIAAMRKARDGAVPSAAHEVKTLALAKEALARDTARGWRILENPTRLRVQTIDSLCSSLARQMPVLSGLSRFRITEEASEFYAEAARATVALVEEEGPDGEAVRGALGHLDNSVKGLIDRLVIMLGKRDQWLRHIEKGVAGSGLRPLLEGSIRRLVEYELKKIKDAFPGDKAGPLALAARHAAANIENKKSPIAGLSTLKGLPGDKASDLPSWKGVRELLLTSGDEWRKPGGVNKKIGFPNTGANALLAKESFQDLLISFEEYDELKALLARAGRLPAPEFSEEEWEALQALVRLLPIAEGKLMEAFAAEGTMDFQGVSLAAIRALGTEDEPTDLMLALDFTVQHILVDEYQDTSHTQLSLIEALTRGWADGDGRTVFVVGDPMQSIYLFREADVGLFLDARLEGIGKVPLLPLTLSRNFRSQAAIVDWVNGAMEEAFPGTEDTFTGAVKYSPCSAVKEGIEGRDVEITVFDNRDDEAEAQKIISIVKERAGESTAILCRSRAHLDSVIAALKKEGIAFRAEGLDPLEERPVVQDLFSLLRALDHPFDRAAWLSILRAPWCGLGLEDIHRLCGGGNSSAVWALMNDARRVELLSKDGRQRLIILREKMSVAMDLWGRCTPSRLLRGLWTGLGGPACVDAPSMEDAEEFFELLEEGDPGRLDIAALEERMKKLYADHGSGAALECMTIHKAKGLEFDNVIMPGLGKTSRNEEKKLLLWLERGEDDLLLAPVEKKGTEAGANIYNYLFSIHKEKVGMEEARLLYVAVTRARKSLYLLGHAKTEDGKIAADSRSFLSKIGHALHADMVAHVDAVQGQEGKPDLRLKRLKTGWEMPEPAEPIPVDNAPRSVETGEPEFYWAGEAIRHLGTVVHRYLCAIAKDGLSGWNEKKVKNEAGRMASMLKSLGLNEAQAASSAKDGISILLKALGDSRGRWILETHEDGSSEFPLTASIGGDIVHVVIDRTFVDAEGVRWVIDYKTGVHGGGSLDEFLSSEKERYRGQLERYAEALRAGGERRTIKKGLYYPAHSEFIEV